MPKVTKRTAKKKTTSRKPRKTPSKAKGPRLDYVKVPKRFEPIFAKAQDFVGKYFSTLKGDASEGTIEAGGERYLLVRAASMSVDFFETMKDLYKGAGEEEALSVARNLLFDIAHAIGKADAKSFHKKMKLTDPVDKLSAGPIHFAYSGWAFVDIFPESRPSPDENYYLIYDHPFSFESAAWLKAEKKSGCPVCIMNAGYSSGWCEESFGITLVAQEIMCKAAGDEACRFIMAPPSRIESYIKEYAEKRPSLLEKIGTYEVPGFFKRKRIEQELRESEEAFRLVFENANDAIFWADPATGSITNCNKAAEKLLEKTKDQIIGQHQTTLHPPDKADLFSEMFKRHLMGNGSAGEEAEVVTASGAVRPVEINSSVTNVGDKQIIQAIFRDIAERKRMETELRAARNNMEQRVELRTAELKRSQQLYQTLAEAAEDFIFIIGPDISVKYVNNFAAKALRRSKDEIVGRELSSLFSQDASRRMETAFRHIFSSGEAMSAENPLRLPAGEIWLHTHLVPLKNESGKVTAVMGLSRDITERQEAEKALRHSEARYRNLFENSPVSLWEENFSEVKRYVDGIVASGVTDVEKYFLSNPESVLASVDMIKAMNVNRATLDMFGAGSKEDLWQNRMKIITDATIPIFTGILAALAAGKKTYHGEGSSLTLAGEHVELSLNFAVLPGYEDTYDKVLISIADITQRKKAEEELRRAIKLKGDFMAMMSHELRTPLTRIISSTHLVLSDPDVSLPEKRVSNLNNVLSSSDALLLMINNALEMARLESGAVPVVPRVCDLRHVVQTCIGGCEGLIEERDVKFATNIDDAVAIICSDKEKLGHILMNLICNGIRYSDKGTVGITAKPSRKEGFVDICVSDEGIGIPPERMGELFEPFKQLQGITKRHPGGIGLGLAIVKANLDLIGGSIDVKSEVGKGSTFTITIPKEYSKEKAGDKL